MRALRLHAGADLRLEEVEPPPLGADEVRVRVEGCGVCGSDVHFLDGNARTGRTPVTLGHEIAGTVETSRHDDWSPGDAVVVAAGVTCGSCRRCSEGREMLCEHLLMTGIDFDGGLAESVVVPGGALLKRPPALAAEVAATAVDAGATPYHALVCRGRVAEGDAVLVVGVGGLGWFGVQIAKLAGAVPIIAADRDPEALARAAGLGADETLLVEPGTSLGRRVKLVTGGGVDIAAEFVGSAATVDACVKSLRPGGVAVAVGVGREPVTTLPPVLWATHEYSLLGSFGAHRADVEAVLESLASGELRPPPLAVVSLPEAHHLLQAAARGDYRPKGRLVVRP